MTRLKDSARFWDVRFDIPYIQKIKQSDGSTREYPTRRHVLACVAAETARDAITMVDREWPDANIWQVNNHGKQCHVLVDESLKQEGDDARG